MRPFRAALLREARERAGLTQEQVAKLLDVTGATISRYETGTRDPDPDTLRRLAGLYQVSVAYLLGTSEAALDPHTSLAERRALLQSSPSARSTSRGLLYARIVGRRLRQAREDMGLSLEDVARQAAISEGQLLDYESNEKMPSDDHLRKLARVLKVGESHLLDEDGGTPVTDGAGERPAPLPDPLPTCMPDLSIPQGLELRLRRAAAQRQVSFADLVLAYLEAGLRGDDAW